MSGFSNSVCVNIRKSYLHVSRRTRSRFLNLTSEDIIKKSATIPVAYLPAYLRI